MKSTFLSFVAALLLCPVIASAQNASSVPADPNGQPSASSADHASLVHAGQYLAQAGDCIACHTAKNGAPFAGGLSFATPIGTIYSSNITPDKDTGIGGWTFEAFDNAVRKGYTPEHSLYPAMPYPNYARLSEQDMRALYAYFMQGVAPVSQANKPVDIAWPMSMRWPLTVWRWAFAPTATPFSAAGYDDPAIARGAYLVEGLGHCSACHTPRSVTMQEKALTGSDTAFLSGGAPIDGWVAKSLRSDGLARWSAEDIATFLKDGRTDHTAAFGGMSDVIQDSMQYMTDADRLAIGKYLKSLPPVAAANPAMTTAYVYDKSTADALAHGEVQKTGAMVYLNNCAACHRSTGLGYSQVFPELAGNAVVQGADATSLINIVLRGSESYGTHSAPSHYVMPPFANRLNDQQVADVVSFIRSGWGNNAGPVGSSQVKTLRAQLHETPDTAKHAAQPE